MEKTLLVGFDSAWTVVKSGAIVGALMDGQGRYRDLGPPEIVNYAQAEDLILEWQRKFAPERSLILLDQPTIVEVETGQRPVENIVCSSIIARRGGMQPASKSRTEMFGADAPIWRFLRRFGGPADPDLQRGNTQVLETYPVLTMIALDWTLADSRAKGRLPKYNPGRRATFSPDDWRHVCGLTETTLRERGFDETIAWINRVACGSAPRKGDQDRLDACLCLLVALHIIKGRDFLVVGDKLSGYIVVPNNADLVAELGTRCVQTGRSTSDWVRVLRLPGSIPMDRQKGLQIVKPYHQLTAAERTAARIELNRKIDRGSKSVSTWTVDEIAAKLNQKRQRASYGAVASVAGGLARGVMNGRAKSERYSWIVAVSGTSLGRPTGYTTTQIHPDCLRQIREGRDNIIDDGEALRCWLEKSS